MLQMGDDPISEEEFENFITVIKKRHPLSTLFLSMLFQCFPIDSEGLHDYKGLFFIHYKKRNYKYNANTLKDSAPEFANDEDQDSS